MLIKEKLLTVMATFKLPIFLQGSLSDNAAYPPAFFTFWNTNSEDGSFYDNAEKATIWRFTVNVYATDPTTVNTILVQLKAALRADGWTIDGAGFDVMSDEPTHTGRAIDITYVERF